MNNEVNHDVNIAINNDESQINDSLLNRNEIIKGIEDKINEDNLFNEVRTDITLNNNQTIGQSIRITQTEDKSSNKNENKTQLSDVQTFEKKIEETRLYCQESNEIYNSDQIDGTQIENQIADNQNVEKDSDKTKEKKLVYIRSSTQGISSLEEKNPQKYYVNIKNEQKEYRERIVPRDLYKIINYELYRSNGINNEFPIDLCIDVQEDINNIMPFLQKTIKKRSKY